MAFYFIGLHSTTGERRELGGRPSPAPRKAGVGAKSSAKSFCRAAPAFPQGEVAWLCTSSPRGCSHCLWGDGKSSGSLLCVSQRATSSPQTSGRTQSVVPHRRVQMQRFQRPLLTASPQGQGAAAQRGWRGHACPRGGAGIWAAEPVPLPARTLRSKAEHQLPSSVLPPRYAAMGAVLQGFAPAPSRIPFARVMEAGCKAP